MQRVLFEHSPYFILVCIAVGIGYAYLLYKAHYAWSKLINQVLFTTRAILVSLLCFLLLGPIIKLIVNEYEKPSWVFLVDNSSSIGEVIDSTSFQQFSKKLEEAGKTIFNEGYSVVIKDFSGNDLTSSKSDFPTSDLDNEIQKVINEYEGKNLAGILLASDGIYNSGISPLYTPIRVPVNTIGLGDTIARVDLILKNVDYNKVAYQGNKFPLKALVLAQGMENQEVTVTVSKNGKVFSSQKKNSADKPLIDYDFLLDAEEKGLQRYDISVAPLDNEDNRRNNSVSVFIEVVEGRKKILLVAPAPHPDIKALRAVVEKNSNYEFIVHIPGVSDTDPVNLKPGAAELVIFHEAVDISGKTSPLFNNLYKGPSSVMLILGYQSNIRLLQANGIPIQFEFKGQWDDVTPVMNNSFRDFSFSENSNGVFSRYPPVQVPFGKFTYPTSSNILLHQRIGSIVTDRPLLFTWEDNNRKVGAMLAEGLWRWRLNEFSENNNTEVFDDLFSKLIQYLSTLEDKRRFRCFPLQNEFTDSEPVVIESQVYNELFELTFGHTVQIQLKDEQGRTTNYSYVTSPGGSRYRIGGLKEGVYKFTATTELSGKPETVSGQFLVKSQNIELQNLTADFGLLRKLSFESGGKFYKENEINKLINDISSQKAASLIHSEESFNQLINLKWVFFILLSLITAEWFIRKYMGGY
jgi:hypothetical protein